MLILSIRCKLTLMNTWKTLLCGAALLTSLNHPLQGAITLAFDQVGSDVVLSFGGTYDISPNNSSTTTSGAPEGSWQVAPPQTSFQFRSTPIGATVGRYYATNVTHSGDLFFEGNAGFAPDSGANGEPFYVGYTEGGVFHMMGTEDFNVGTALAAGSLTWEDTAIGALNLKAGNGSFTIEGQVFNWSVVPEPSSSALLGGALVLFLAVSRRK